MCVYYKTGTPEGSTESGFMEKPGIEPATAGLQGIVLIHYTTGASDRSKAVLLLLIICVILTYLCLMLTVCHAFASVHCCLVVTCWGTAWLLFVMFIYNCVFVTFPCGILGQVWYLIVSIPGLCCLSYLYFLHV